MRMGQASGNGRRSRSDLGAPQGGGAGLQVATVRVLHCRRRCPPQANAFFTTKHPRMKQVLGPVLRCQRPLANLCDMRGLEGCLKALRGLPAVGASAMREFLVDAGGLKASRIPPACASDPVTFDLGARWFSLAKPRFTTGYLPCFAFGCLRFATALRELLIAGFSPPHSHAQPHRPQTGDQDGPSPARTPHPYPRHSGPRLAASSKTTI